MRDLYDTNVSSDAEFSLSRKIVAIGFSGDDLSSLVIGAIVVLISWVMEEGRKLEEDNILTV